MTETSSLSNSHQSTAEEVDHVTRCRHPSCTRHQRRAAHVRTRSASSIDLTDVTVITPGDLMTSGHTAVTDPSSAATVRAGPGRVTRTVYVIEVQPSSPPAYYGGDEKPPDYDDLYPTASSTPPLPQPSDSDDPHHHNSDPT